MMISCPRCHNETDGELWACLGCGEPFEEVPADLVDPATWQESVVPVADAVAEDYPAAEPELEPLAAPVARPAPADAKPRKKTRPVHRLAFHGTGGAIFGMHVVTILLSIVTLGIYSFWGKVKLRQHLFGQLEFHKQRFAYHGTGRELFIGRLKLVALLFVVVGLPEAALGAVMLPTIKEHLAKHDPSAVLQLAGLETLPYLLIFVLLPFAMIGSRRYLLSRTSWAGIRFAFDGKVGEFAQLYLKGLLLTILTLGLYGPYFEANINRYMIDHSAFGTRHFSFTGTGKLMLKDYIIALVLHLPTLGLIWLWYGAKRQRVYADHTRFGKVRFRSTITGRKMFSLVLGNALMMAFSCGLALPWVRVRSMRNLAENLVLLGDLELTSILQQKGKAGAAGADMADMLGLDVGIAF